MPRFTRHVFDRWTAGRAGQAEGRLGLPVESESLPPYLRGLRAAGIIDLRLAAERWERRDGPLLRAWRQCQLRFEHALAALQRAAAIHRRTRAEYAPLNGSPAERIASRIYAFYWVLVGLFAIAEFPLNLFAFRLLGEAEFWTWIAAGSIGIALIAAAHFLGIGLRNEVVGRWRVAVLLVGLAAFATLSVFGLAVLRRVLLSSGGHGLVVLDPLSALGVYFLIQMLILSVATYASWRAHPELLEHIRRTRRQQARARRVAEQAALEAAAARTRRESAYEEARADAERTQYIVEILAARYWDRVLIARTERDGVPEAYPAAYGSPLTLGLPAVFASPLAWELDIPEEVPDADADDGPVEPPDDAPSLPTGQMLPVAVDGMDGDE